tara:strand:- start:499 stop:1398 length:900 start_codon:yes stop_codon:yes gene_type:complete
MNSDREKTGFIALIGRTNVGKSTLLNEILQQKISITSRKPQTTRHKLIGIKTNGGNQIIFLDTPGFHRSHKKALNKHMNKVALSAIKGVDMVLFMVESLRFSEEDKSLLDQIPKNKENVFLIINKIDKTSSKNDLLPFISSLSGHFNFTEVIPISALKKINIENVENAITSRLPFGQHLYPKDQVADTTERFLSSEIIREKCITRVGDEIPYCLTVVIDEFKEQEKITHINATLYVEKNSQKGIVIGKEGRKLKAIGTSARKELEDILATKVMLKLWVKVSRDWTNNTETMNSMGFNIG